VLNVGHERLCYQFGRFHLDAAQRLLLRDGQPVALQPKAMDILLLLVRNPGQAITKENLLANIWPGMVVEESNLSQNIFLLRKVLGDGEGGRRYIVTLPRRGYQFAEQVRVCLESTEEGQAAASAPPTDIVGATGTGGPHGRFRAPVRYLLPAIICAVIAVILVTRSNLQRARDPRVLAVSDTIVLADFTNGTGDAVFEGTLRQALAAQLEQSPLLNLLSDQRVATTLALMRKPKDEPISGQVASEICQRTGSAVVIDGDIARLGSQYLLTLKASACGSGETLGRTQARASDKDHVLDALGTAATALRRRLGESLDSVQKYDAPPEAVTTPSLDALHAYSAAYRTMIRSNDYPGAVPLFERAIALDPKFAMAYARLGINYFNLGEPERAQESLRKAYELADRLSDREQLYIAASYNAMARGDFVAARRSYELWSQIYPRDQFAIGNLGVVYSYLGEYDKSLAAIQKAWELNPQNALVFSNIVSTLTQLNRLDEARAMAGKARGLGLESHGLQMQVYMIDFLQHDTIGMQQEVAALLDTPGWSDVVLHAEANTAAYGGEFARARELTSRAVEAAERDDKKEAAATYQAESAVREALVGNTVPAARQAAGALALSDSKSVRIFAAIAFGVSGDAAQARRVADALARDLPQDTVFQFNAAPTIQAAVALSLGDPSQAIQALQVAQQYELGQTEEPVGFMMYPVYWRAQADLAAGRKDAFAEFKKIIDHPGIAQNELIAALARLGQARAYAAANDSQAAKAAYQTFLSNWDHADPDLPILKSAKAEYARLR
jgi:DNA-binding winged helix-turn-helix (wHTH) protein/tetratricopeptide (TPR) repeat protein